MNFFETLIASLIALFTFGICSNTSKIVTTSNVLSLKDKLVDYIRVYNAIDQSEFIKEFIELMLLTLFPLTLVI